MGGSWARDGKEMAGQALTSLLQEEALGISGSQPLTTPPPPPPPHQPRTFVQTQG